MVTRMRRTRLTVTALAALAAITAFPAAVTATSTSTTQPAAASFHAPVPCGRRAHSRPDIRHVIVIVMENHSYSQVIGPARYLTALAKVCGLATNYHSVGSPSLPNYLAMTSGSTHGLSVDCDPAQCAQSGLSIFAQLSLRSKLWQAFDESMPSNCSLSGTNLYAPRHNPAVYYTSVRRWCRVHDVRLGTPASGPFRNALRGRLGSFVFVTPNICNDMHDCSVATGDAWLAKWIPAIRGSRVYRAGHTAIIVTFDEGAQGHVATVVVSPYTRAGMRSSQLFSHYSLLHASEYVLHIHAFLGHAASAGGLGKAFRLVP
jgi:phosphatidylinositol-3-phosphatase